MELNEFALLVQRMRNTQKEYFTTQSKSALKDAKKLEGQVDKAVNTILGETVPTPGRRQTNMFMDPAVEDIQVVEEEKKPEE
jgi:hypothetical protein